MPHIPHSLCLIENGNIFNFSCIVTGCGRDLFRVNFYTFSANRYLQFSQHVIPISMDNLNKPTHLPFRLRFRAPITLQLFFYNFVSSKRFRKHFNKWSVT